MSEAETKQSIELPIVVAVHIPEPEPFTYDPDRVTTEIYCVNTTGSAFTVQACGDSFTTVDDETGAAVQHGSPAQEVTLAPGEHARIGDVVEWEWDGAVAFVVSFRREGETASRRYLFGMRSGSLGDYHISAIDATGCILPGTPWD